jgi:predicted anti-sigma-YlaC factor YlaD
MAPAEDLTCAELVELVTEYLEGALAAEDQARFEEHLTLCEGCVNYLEQMRTTVALAGQLRVDDLSPEVSTELIEAFRGWHAISLG